MTMKVGYTALVGRPNVGKSTLLNQLLQQKLVITSHKPQTTRHRILGIKTNANGQIVYVDTPGIHRRGVKAMNRYLNRTAQATLAGVDVCVFVVQALESTEEDAAVLEAIRREQRPVVTAVNKVDFIRPKEKLLSYLKQLHGFGLQVIVPVSALSGKNCSALEEEVLKHLPAGELVFPEDQLSDRPERFFAAEFLREQLTRRYNKEIPYALSVEIERFEHIGRGLRIGAVVWVEKANQKAIIIGRAGASLKQAATAARREMRDFYAKPVHLEVWVKVKKSWSSDEQSLLQLGYTE